MNHQESAKPRRGDIVACWLCRAFDLMPLLTELGNSPGWTRYKDAAPTALRISQRDYIIQPGVADGIGYAG